MMILAVESWVLETSAPGDRQQAHQHTQKSATATHTVLYGKRSQAVLQIRARQGTAEALRPGQVLADMARASLVRLAIPDGVPILVFTGELCCDAVQQS